MVKVLIIEWIVTNCDNRMFTGMQWDDREQGIFWLYWKHQSSRSCRENSDESSSYYEYCYAWGRHKNNNRRRQPRDVKAAFRNALEKKPELERLKHLDTKDRIYWRIQNFPNGKNNCGLTKEPMKKPKGSNKGRKPINNLFQNGDEFTMNFGASTSTTGEDANFGSSTSTEEGVPLQQKKPRRPYTKRSKKVPVKTENSIVNELPMNGATIDHEDEKNQFPLPSVENLLPFFKKNERDNVSWEGPLKSTNSNFSSNPNHFSEATFDNSRTEDIWTPQLFASPTERNTPPQYSSDLMEVPFTEQMDFLVLQQRTNYSFLDTPPQQTSDMVLEKSEDLLSLGNINNGEEHTILKYSFPFQPKRVPTSQSYQTNTSAHQIPVTSQHYSMSDFTSPTKTSNFQNNNCILDSITTPENAFYINHQQQFCDQVVPQNPEAFHINQQLVNTSDLLANDWLPNSPDSMDNQDVFSEQMCHQQAVISNHSIELFRRNRHTSNDDSGISDMEDFLECANQLLDAIDSKYDNQWHPMY